MPISTTCSGRCVTVNEDGQAEFSRAKADERKLGEQKPVNAGTLDVLFVCTGNSARSIMGEALLNQLGRDACRGFSAGSHPLGRVHPLALELLAAKRLPAAHLRSKSWDEFAAPGAEPLDVVIVVCANAAGEYCPHWPGDPVTGYWCLDDPAVVQGPEAQRRQAFLRTYDEIEIRVRALIDLPIRTLDRRGLRVEIDAIGATSPYVLGAGLPPPRKRTTASGY